MLLDIAFGILLGKYFALNFFSKEYYFYIIFLGVIFTLLPDIDFIKFKRFNFLVFRSKLNFANRLAHRGIIHTPVFYIFISVVLFLVEVNLKIILMFLIGTFFHLLHDLFVLGRGVMIFYPFSKNRLKVFPDDGADGYMKRKVLWWNEDKTPLYTFYYNDKSTKEDKINKQNKASKIYKREKESKINKDDKKDNDHIKTQSVLSKCVVSKSRIDKNILSRKIISKNVVSKSFCNDDNNWIRIWYLRPNLFVFIETSIAIVFLILYFLI